MSTQKGEQNRIMRIILISCDRFYPYSMLELLIIFTLNNTYDVVIEFVSPQFNMYTIHKINMNRLLTLKFILNGCCSVFFACLSFFFFC